MTKLVVVRRTELARTPASACPSPLAIAQSEVRLNASRRLPSAARDGTTSQRAGFVGDMFLIEGLNAQKLMANLISTSSAQDELRQRDKMVTAAS